MDEVILANLIKKICAVIGVLGIVAGLDLITGAKALYALKRILDRAFYIDEIIIRFSSLFRKTLDRQVDFDKTVLQARSRVFFGVVLLSISILMILLIMTTP